MAKEKEEREYTEEEFRVLQKVGVHFSREELKTLEELLKDKSTKLSASSSGGSAAYHR